MVPDAVILVQAPAGFIDVPKLEAAFLEPYLEAYAEDGRHIAGTDPAGQYRLWLQVPERMDSRLAVLIPLNADFKTRVEGALRFERRLKGEDAGSPPSRMNLTRMQRSRLILMLRAIDGRTAGASYREIAGALLDPSVEKLRARDWKSSAAHSQVYRWVTDAGRLIGGGYLDLLKGDWP